MPPPSSRSDLIPVESVGGRGGTTPAAGNSVPLALTHEGERVMRICNACRYCEGFCAVFPAMERRYTFSEQDLNYLANLCHNCGECYHSCPYAPPHEFLLNPPRIFAEIRVASYQKYSWPGFLGGLFKRNGAALTSAMIGGPALFLAALLFWVQPSVFFSAHTFAQGSFYAVLSHVAMTAVFLIVSLFVVAALLAGVVLFWRDMNQGMGEWAKAPVTLPALARATGDALRLRYLEGGGDGCANETEAPSHARRWFHHLTFYGFMLCFAATTLAAIYHYLFHWEAPYRFLSGPVLLGTVGGVGLLAGPVGLLWLKHKRDPQTGDPKQSGMDNAFLILLLLTSITGLLLLLFRETAAMGVLLGVHLGIVLGLFVTMPYGKFVHATYRLAALVRNAIEKRQPLARPAAE